MNDPGLIQPSTKIVLSGKCYGYVRVSTGKQADQGCSLEVQKAEIKRYVEYHRYELIETFEDAGRSAAENKLKRRKGLIELLNVLQIGDAVIVHTLSRLSRSLREFLQITKIIEDKKCALVLILEKLDSGNPYGNFTINLIALLGQLEVELTRNRNLSILKHKRMTQQFVGRIPYGWKIKEHKSLTCNQTVIEKCETEQAVIKYIYDLYADPVERHTYQSIAVKLNMSYVPPPEKSRKWYDTQIKRILNRKSGPGVPYVEPKIVKGKVVSVPDVNPPKPKKVDIDMEKLMDYIAPIMPLILQNQRIIINLEDLHKFVLVDDDGELQQETTTVLGVEVPVY